MIVVYDLLEGTEPVFVIAPPDTAHGATGREEGLAFDGSCNFYLADDEAGGFPYGQVRKYGVR